VNSPESDPIPIRARRRPARWGPSIVVQAVLVTAVIPATLAACLAWDRPFVAWLAAEDSLVEAVRAFSGTGGQSDDITLVILRRNGA